MDIATQEGLLTVQYLHQHIFPEITRQSYENRNLACVEDSAEWSFYAHNERMGIPLLNVNRVNNEIYATLDQLLGPEGYILESRESLLEKGHQYELIVPRRLSQIMTARARSGDGYRGGRASGDGSESERRWRSNSTGSMAYAQTHPRANSCFRVYKMEILLLLALVITCTSLYLFIADRVPTQESIIELYHILSNQPAPWSPPTLATEVVNRNFE